MVNLDSIRRREPIWAVCIRVTPEGKIRELFSNCTYDEAVEKLAQIVMYICGNDSNVCCLGRKAASMFGCTPGLYDVRSKTPIYALGDDTWSIGTIRCFVEVQKGA